MIQKIKNYLFMIAAAAMLAVPALAPLAVSSVVSADSVCGPNTIGDSVSAGANVAAGQTGLNSTCETSTGVDQNSLATIGNKAVNIFSVVVGVIAIIMIIVGGFRYITSGGASDRVSGAKNTLIYAIIGLVIVALAQIIVHFVLNQTNTAVSS